MTNTIHKVLAFNSSITAKSNVGMSNVLLPLSILILLFFYR